MKRSKKLKEVLELSEIGMISDTRWACRYKNIASLKKSFLPLLKMLTQLLYPSNAYNLRSSQKFASQGYNSFLSKNLRRKHDPCLQNDENWCKMG